jgi:tetratricopeptide (TPR) repeat protein
MTKTNNVKNNDPVDYYKLLNVPADSSIEQITIAYRSIARDCSQLLEAHSEMKSRIENEFVQFQNAFKTLTNKNEKEKYDLTLKLLELKKREEKLVKEKAEKLKSDDYENTRIKISTTGPLSFTFSKFKVVEIDEKKINKILEEKQNRLKMIGDMFIRAKKFILDEDFELAIDLLLKLIDTNPKESSYHSYFGLALLKNGLANLAREEFEMAASLNPNDPVAAQYLYDNGTSSETGKSANNEKKEQNNSSFINRFKEIIGIRNT